MVARHSLEGQCIGCVTIKPSSRRWNVKVEQGFMADRAVVVVHFLAGDKRYPAENRRACQAPVGCDHILMPIMRKLDCELSRVFWVSKGEPLISAWGNGRVADTTNYRFGTTKKLGSVTTHACRVVGIIDDVGIVRYLLPVASRSLVAGATGLLMFRSRVQEARIVDDYRTALRYSPRSALPQCS